MTDTKKISYVAAIIEPKTVKKLVDWSKKAIPKDALLISKVNGTTEGGNVLRDAHLTLFFGLNDDLIDKHAVEELIKKISVSELEILRIGSFLVPEKKCKILYFAINDDNNQLLSIHNEFLKMPHYEDRQKPFSAHITIAYVKELFNEKTIQYNESNKLPIRKIEYIKYN